MVEATVPAAAAPNRAFLLVLFGQVVSAFGSGLTSFAVAVWVYQQSQSLLQFGAVMFVNAIVTALSAPLLGVACDRYPLRRMMLIGDCGAALLTALMLWAMLSAQLVLWMLLIAVALDAVFSTLHQIAYRSAVPAMVPRDGLARANGLVETGLALSRLLAPLAAGALLGTVGLVGIFMIDLATFVVAVLTLACARFPRVEADDGIARTRTQGAWASMREGWHYLRQQPGLWRLLLVILYASFALGGVQVLFMPMVLAVHGAAVLGMLTTLAGIGMLAAGLFISIDGRSASLRGVLHCQLLLAILLIALAASTSVLWLAVFAFAVHAVSQWGSISARTLWQRDVAAAMRGRVFAFVSATSALVVPFAQLGAPWLAEAMIGPWLERGSPLAQFLVLRLGDGDGAAAAICIAMLGIALLMFALFARASPHWRTPGESSGGVVEGR
jgi:MFS family permease